MSSIQRCTRAHSIRRGQSGDLPTGIMVDKDTTPFYVLVCNGVQVGAMDGAVGIIAFLAIFEPHQGVKHSEIFLEFIEADARSKGIKRISMGTPTIEAKMIRAFERCGFALEEEESDGNRWYYKDL
jgi:N-acetylglutamate synthase-like GNAT family acetyltransferase